MPIRTTPSPTNPVAPAPAPAEPPAAATITGRPAPDRPRRVRLRAVIRVAPGRPAATDGRLAA